jgi:uncharacterized membrane protein
MMRYYGLVLPLLLALFLVVIFVGGHVVLTQQFRPLRAMRQSAIESLKQPQRMPAPAATDSR